VLLGVPQPVRKVLSAGHQQGGTHIRLARVATRWRSGVAGGICVDRHRRRVDAQRRVESGQSSSGRRIGQRVHHESPGGK
jgi:hypothetical protein